MDRLGRPQELTERFGDAHEALPTLDDSVQFYHDVIDLVGQFVAKRSHHTRLGSIERVSTFGW